MRGAWFILFKRRGDVIVINRFSTLHFSTGLCPHSNERANADDFDEIEGQSTGRHHRPCHESKTERKEVDSDPIL